jgi:hypothetical protein
MQAQGQSGCVSPLRAKLFNGSQTTLVSFLTIKAEAWFPCSARSTRALLTEQQDKAKSEPERAHDHFSRTV